MSEMDPRAEDWADERTDDSADDESTDAPVPDDLDIEAPEADVIEQRIDVDLDDDDYR